jgi:hypothetical protein
LLSILGKKFESGAFPSVLSSSVIVRFLFLVTLTVGTLLMAQKTDLQDGHAYTRVPVSFQRIMTRTPAPEPITALSAFDQELVMTPQELLDRWNPLIAEASRRFDISEAWIRAVMRMESGGRTMLGENQPITSSVGAMGVMQVMPETYADMRAQYGLGADPYDPHDNIFAGAAYLRWLYHKYGYAAMFAAYNDGPGNLEDHLQRERPFPAETRAYIDGVAGILGSGPLRRTRSASELAKLTRPDGSPVLIDGSMVEAIRAPLPGEYDPDVQSVITIGRLRQAVQENMKTATALIREHGGRV